MDTALYTNYFGKEVPMDHQQQARIEALRQKNRRLGQILQAYKKRVRDLAWYVFLRANADQSSSSVESRAALRHQDHSEKAALPSSVQALEHWTKKQNDMEQTIHFVQMPENPAQLTLEVLENERRDIAQELHDGIGADLAAIKLIAEEHQHRSANREDTTAHSLEPIIHHLANTIKQTKRMAARLRPSMLDDLGLRSTLAWYHRDFRAAYKDIHTEHQFDLNEKDIPEDRKIVIFRIVQEAMRNAAKHARPTVIRSVLDMEGHYIRLRIQDNGCGFDAHKLWSSNDRFDGRGLRHMRQRIELCGGVLTVESDIALGTQIRVWLPVRLTAGNRQKEKKH